MKVICIQTNDPCVHHKTMALPMGMQGPATQHACADTVDWGHALLPCSQITRGANMTQR